MVGLPSGDRRGQRPAGLDGVGEAPQTSLAYEDDEVLADRDQTLADADQTGSDSDQSSADSDQWAADRDQAASDLDLGHGTDPAEHERSRHIRERSTRRREKSAVLRLRVADQRDAVASARDLAAVARDRAADARSLAMAQRDSAREQDLDERAASGSDADPGGAGRRERDLRQRAQAAEQRELAAQDRQAAARDRKRAAQERLRAREDRAAFAVELQREQARREQALGHQHRAEQLARTLQRSLSPPRLPSVAGLDVAVHHEPFAIEEVGGDFYDLFVLGAGRMGFFFGDVCGKGPDAAAVTSLARYTMRTAAMLHQSPEAILLDLNAALLMQTDEPMQTCTTIYGEIRTSGESFAVTLAAAGHPAPMIVRARGGVEPVPAHGTMLGVVEDPAFCTCQIVLDAGDAIVVWSDGIYDAQLDGRAVDEHRVAELLRGAPGAGAQALVERLKVALKTTERSLRDDVAIMVIRRTPPMHELQA